MQFKYVSCLAVWRYLLKRQAGGCGRLYVAPRDLGMSAEGKRGTCAAMQKCRHSNFFREWTKPRWSHKQGGLSVLMHGTYLIICPWFSINRREAGLRLWRKWWLPTTFLSRKATRGPQTLVGDMVLGLPLWFRSSRTWHWKASHRQLTKMTPWIKVLSEKLTGS